MPAEEINFDGIVGPTHNYSGLAVGNLASAKHRRQVSSPRQAALQGLEKMKYVHDLGVGQAVLPPLRRPDLKFLNQLGFKGAKAQVIDRAWQANPVLLSACYSASSMWTANAATVSPSADCRDGKLHITPANLSSGLHRSIEHPNTTAVLRAIFANEDHFQVHDALPSGHALSDEGAANHTRLCNTYAERGLETFVFGRSALDKSVAAPGRFPARQTLEASQAVVRNHELESENAILIQQTPVAIDAGVFHNDVISVGNRNFLMFHEQAFVDSDATIAGLQKAAAKLGWELQTICFSESELSLNDAVNSYLFNSQLLSRPDGGMTLLCPLNVKEIEASRICAERLLSEDNPVDHVEFMDLRQSMNNGGGPACLRLRVVVTESERAAMHQGVLFDNSLYSQLKDWVNKHYRKELAPDDLRDPKLVDEVDAAFVELSTILDLPPGVFGL